MTFVFRIENTPVSEPRPSADVITKCSTTRYPPHQPVKPVHSDQDGAQFRSRPPLVEAILETVEGQPTFIGSESQRRAAESIACARRGPARQIASPDDKEKRQVEDDVPEIVKLEAWCAGLKRTAGTEGLLCCDSNSRHPRTPGDLIKCASNTHGATDMMLVAIRRRQRNRNHDRRVF